MRLPWSRAPRPPLEMCSVGGCGNAATHRLLIDHPTFVAGYLDVPLCDECDKSPTVQRPGGYWQALDPVTADDVEEDRMALPGWPSPYANNIVLPSGRSWRFVA